MGSEFKKALIVFAGFVLLLAVILGIVIQRYSQYDSIIEAMEMVDFNGIFLAFMGAAVLNLISIGLTFNLARAWVNEKPEFATSIFRLTLIISITFIIIIGGLAGGIIVLRTLWTIGAF